MQSLRLMSHSAEQTQFLGVCLGKLAQPGDVYLLSGGLGTGKTCLTQGIAWGLDIKEYAFSPTFILVREHQGRLPLYHMDFYRLDRPEEIEELGVNDYLYGKGVSVVEWPEKSTSLPTGHLAIALSHVSELQRAIELQATARRYFELIGELAATLEKDKEWSWR